MNRYFVEIEVPEEVEILELKVEDLPESWNGKPPSLETQFIGDDFVREMAAAVLKVPSRVVPQEFNYLINPDHPDARKITVFSKSPLVFDNRMGSSKGNGIDKRN